MGQHDHVYFVTFIVYIWYEWCWLSIAIPGSRNFEITKIT